MIADVWTLQTTYRIQIKDDTGAWHEHSQAEYESADDIHELAAQMYGGLPRNWYRLVEISRKVIYNLCDDANCPDAWAEHDIH